MQSERTLYVAWQNPETRGISPVGLLVEHQSAAGTDYTFGYLKVAEALDGFQELPGLPDLHRRYDSPVLFPVFANRVMSPERPDYASYVERLDLGPDPEPFVVLGRSEGSRATDRIEVFRAPERDEAGRITCVFFARGIRHVGGAASAVDALRAGDVLRLVDEPKNPINQLALRLHQGSDRPVGYAPDYLVEVLHELREQNGCLPDVEVVRVNSAETAPQLRLLCRFAAPAVEGYEPFSGSEFQPLVDLSNENRPTPVP